MASLAQVTVHSSQFPESVRRELLESLRVRRVNHKFHYDSLKQTQKWLALHQAFSPSRTDPDCAATYDRAFDELACRVTAPRVQLIGLGCGGGQKDTRLLRQLRDAGKDVAYAPVDVSVAMVLTARAAAQAVVPEGKCFPLVCDLATAEDLPAVFEDLFADPQMPVVARLFTFFGMLPNFEPRLILPRLASVIRPGDTLLLSANLSPGADYAAGLRRILPLYDNGPTRDWLMTFLFDLGVEAADGELTFAFEDDPAHNGLKRVAAWFQFSRARQIRVEEHLFDFTSGERVRLFFSYRHTPELIRGLLGPLGLQVREQWITNSGEEGVFLAGRLGSR